ncbi:TAXI family TRAP transporter solute-binding subunit [bacterium]|nr:MAG: TAXI family TRAP transporter solute-binding subunit [bacterium]
MNKTKVIRVCVCLLLVLPIFFIPNPANAQKKTNLTIAAGPLGGAFYPISGGIAAIVNAKVDDLNINVQVTGGGVENTRMIGRGRVDIGLVGADQAYYGVNKLEMFKNDSLKLETLGTLHPTVFQYVTLKKTGIKTIDDLKGKKVAIGEPGGGSEMSFNIMLRATKLTKNDIRPVYLPYEQAVEQLADGLIDAAVITAGVPTSAVTSLATNHDIVLIEIPDRIWVEYHKLNPFVILEEFPAGIYRGFNVPVKMIVARIQLASRQDLDEGIAYKIAKAVYSNLGQLATYHAAAKFIKAETAYKTSIPQNKGAEKFFKEAGFMK